jgi:hypothetical protein
MRKARNAPIEAIEYERDKNRQRRLIEAAAHRLHNRKKTGEQRDRREKVGEPIDAAAADSAAFTQPLVFRFVQHA